MKKQTIIKSTLDYLDPIELESQEHLCKEYLSKFVPSRTNYVTQSRPTANFIDLMNWTLDSFKDVLKDQFNINKFVRGKLSATAQVNASLANAIGLNGIVKTHFEDGAVLDASKFKDLGEDKVMATIVGLFKESHFKDLYLDLTMTNGKPALKYFKLIENGGKVTEIDFTKDLGKLLENQVKKEIDTVVDKEKERLQKEIDDKAKAEKERLENEVKNQLNNIKF
jgi:hypothetical protein